ncbi:hypothetical protein E5K00_17560 [Hymenobacter aquaticus]|uniref:DUF4168 domain-containing protein n=1 Tax=Hymenobacter aquaticus TaxID=1867101 RepID=A0A4Z0PXM4_9BACT|nr:hypothetical protein [Hymenobacter aquaticus]TGE22059.1 hypothetical protein E5K00_17560 [Hymenobacter aquaticus]
MKKLSFFFLAAALGSALSAAAQQAPDLRNQAMDNTRQLAQRIGLDDARTPQVKRATYERLVQENELKQMYGIDPAMLQSKMTVVDKEYAEKLKGILTDAQYQRYVAVTAAAATPPAAPVATAAVVPAAPATVLTPKAPAKKDATPKAKTMPGAPVKKALPKAATASVPQRS